jgi:hypothetical protein
VHTARHTSVVLPADYVALHVDLAYATTVNRTQGMTADITRVVVPNTMTREQYYTATTRGRHANHSYVETVQHVVDEHRETPPEQTAGSVLTGVLNHTGLETAAAEELRRALAEEESLGTLVMRYTYAARYGEAEHYEQLITRHAPEAVGQPAYPALVQTLRNGQDLGWSTEQLLGDAVDQGTLRTARDPAAVLQWRIQQRLDHRQPPTEVAGAELPFRPALPWLPRPRPELVRDEPELVQFLSYVNDAIEARAGELGQQVTRDQPRWAENIQPVAVDMAAAYRETFNISSDDPELPLGPDPEATTVKAQAWSRISQAQAVPDQPSPAEPDADEDLDRRLDQLHDRVTAPPRHTQEAMSIEDDQSFDEQSRLHHGQGR